MVQVRPHGWSGGGVSKGGGQEEGNNLTHEVQCPPVLQGHERGGGKGEGMAAELWVGGLCVQHFNNMSRHVPKLLLTQEHHYLKFQSSNQQFSTLYLILYIELHIIYIYVFFFFFLHVPPRSQLCPTPPPTLPRSLRSYSLDTQSLLRNRVKILPT